MEEREKAKRSKIIEILFKKNLKNLHNLFAIVRHTEMRSVSAESVSSREIKFTNHLLLGERGEAAIGTGRTYWQNFPFKLSYLFVYDELERMWNLLWN